MSWSAPTQFPDLSKAKAICIDLETYDPNLKTLGPGDVRDDGYILGVAIGTPDGWGQYYPLRHPGGGNLDAKIVFEWLNEELSRSNQPKYGANIGYDIGWLAWAGVSVSGPLVDVQNDHALIDENTRSRGLDFLADYYGVGEKLTHTIEDAAREAGIKWSGDVRSILYKLPASVVGPYGIMDVKLPFLIAAKQAPMIVRDGLEEVVQMERELIPLFIAMRRQGVRVDVPRAKALAKEMRASEEQLKKELIEMAGFPVITPESGSVTTANLVKVCEKLSIDWPFKTSKGNPSFKKDYLEAHDHEFFKLLVEYKQVNKIRKDFVEGDILGKHYKGRLYPSIYQMAMDDGGTVTGRLSMQKPNLQQQPIRHEKWGPLLRSLYIPDEGFQWAKLDYSQQEPRIGVHLAAARGYVGAEQARQNYINDKTTDFHQMAADIITEVVGEDFPRKKAKNAKLGKGYGLGASGFAAKYGYTEEEARLIYSIYDEALGFERELMREASSYAGRRGWVKTALGRRRRFNCWEPYQNEWDSKTRKWKYEGVPKPEALLKQKSGEWPQGGLKRAYTFRAVNAIIQGTAADITKMAMLKCWKETGNVPLLQVHDELNFNIKMPEEAVKLAQIMEEALPLSVPMLVEPEIGPSWGEVEGI